MVQRKTVKSKSKAKAKPRGDFYGNLPTKWGYSYDGKNWNSEIVKFDEPCIYLGYKAKQSKRFQRIEALKYVAPTDIPTPVPPGPEAPAIGKLAVVNASSHSDNDVQKWVNACEKQADHEIAKYWGYSLDVEFVAKGEVIPKADIYCGILNDTEEAGALGWHDYANGIPSIKVFAGECDKYNIPPSTCVSHEFAEMIGDLNCNTTVRGYDEQGKACLYFRENADPVEDDSFAYQIDNVPVSDFILPTWFQKGTQGPYDFKNKCKKPFELLYGGYMLVSYDNGATWNQIDKFDKENNKQHQFWQQSHVGEHGRWAIYQKVLKGEPLQECDIDFGTAKAGGTLYEQGKL